MMFFRLKALNEIRQRKEIRNKSASQEICF